MSNYEKLLERICKASGLSIEEIERKIEAKKAKLSGLISKEGAAQIVTAELGINLEQEKLKISEIVEGMRKVNLSGKIVKINPVREFNKNGREGKVASLLIGDETASTRLVLWDTHHIELIESEKLKEGDVIEIAAGSVRNSEIHLTSFSEIKKTDEKIENVVASQTFQERKLEEAKAGENLMTRATIVQAFEPRYFEVNPETGKKFTEADKNNGLQPKKRALLNIVLDDGTGTIRSVLFGDQINLLGLTNEQIFSLEEFNKVKPTLLGEEHLFSGQLRQNQLYNTTEFTIQGVEKIQPQKLVKELEAKA